MWKTLIVLICLSGYCCAGPLNKQQKKNMPIGAREDNAPVSSSELGEDMMPEATAEESAPEMSALMSTLTLPSNATSIRAEITDNFSCENRAYGYYADIENDCQIFHVCLPVTYADGKENTFRWSFICPEETIFSQESFTCMRREDMAIGCEESAKYYELNRNFGNVEEDNNKPSNNQAVQQDQTPAAQQVAEPVFVESEPAPPAQPAVHQPKPVKVQKPIRRKPAVSYNTPKKEHVVNTMPLRKLPQPTPALDVEEPAEELEIAATQAAAEEIEAKPAPQRYNKRPAQAATSPKEKLQPVKTVEEPAETHVEEPAVIVAQAAEIENKPAPQRYHKRPAVAAMKDKVQSLKTVVPAVALPEPVEKPVEEPIAIATQAAEVEAKPVPQRFNKRPINNIKEKIQSVKTESAPIRTELYNQKRKRPSVFNKKEVPTTGSPAEEAAQTETISSQPELGEPEPTLKLETMFTATQEAAAQEAVAQEGAAQEAAALPAIVQDAVAEASEPVAALAQPEETKKVESEPVETVQAATFEETKIPSEPVSDIVAEPLGNDLKKLPEIPVAPAPIEAIEEIPAVIVEAEEQKPQDAASEVAEKVEKTAAAAPVAEQQVDEVKPVDVQADVAPAENTQEDNQEENKVKTGLGFAAPAAGPAIFEQTDSIEAANNNIEALEAAKPADAPESMPATPEMEQHSPIVEEMLEQNDAHHQTLGGFKPVAPEMAAEAEQLITDFLNTLRTHDIKTQEQAENLMQQADVIEPTKEEDVPKIVELSQEESEPELPQKSDILAEAQAEQEKTEDAVAEPEPVALTAEEAKLSEENQPSTNDADNSIEEQKTDNTEAEKAIIDADNTQPQYLRNGAPISNILMLDNLPADMYQIPVKVIETPIDEEPIAAETTAQELKTTAEEAQTPNKIEEIPANVEQAPISEEPTPVKVEETVTKAEEAPIKNFEAPINAEEAPMNDEEAPINAEQASINAEQVPAMPGFASPLSIDDIVEMVKERLDQTPKGEQPKPMELVLTTDGDQPVAINLKSANDDETPAAASVEVAPISDVQSEKKAEISDEQPAAQENEVAIPAKEEEPTPALKTPVETENQAVPEATKSDDAEDVVVPIYQRVIEAEPSLLRAQPQLIVEEKEPVVTVEKAVQTEPATEQQTAAETQAKASRAYRARSVTHSKMDARKRRFLFRADAS